MKLKALILIAFVGLLSLNALARAEKAKNSGTLSFYMENDFFFQLDRYYTSGLKLTWISPDLKEDTEGLRLARWLYSLIKRPFFIDRAEFLHAVSFCIGHDLYTPDELARYDLIVDDRPYAGMFYIGIGFHNKGKRRMSTLEFDLGVVGPLSFAEKFQKTIHKWFDWVSPNGWDHQLKNEPALRVIYDHKWKLARSGGDGYGVDWIARIRGGVGNVYTGAGIGMQVRLGLNLPGDFGTFPKRLGGEVSDIISRRGNIFSGRNQFGFHAFAAVDGQAVLRNIFLDGNTFRDSHRVDKEPFVADLIIGAALRAGRFKISYFQIYQTRRFKIQQYKHKYGSLNLSFSY